MRAAHGRHNKYIATDSEALSRIFAAFRYKYEIIY